MPSEADCEYEHPDVLEQCFESFHTEAPGFWVCTRPKGHDGPHVMCIPNGQHAAAVQEASA